MKSLGPALSSRANHSLASSTGSSKTPVLTRRTCTFSPRNRNSLGNLTAWLRPLRNSFATTRSGTVSSLEENHQTLKWSISEVYHRVVIRVVIWPSAVGEKPPRPGQTSSKRAQKGRKRSRWTRVPKFRDRKAPGSNPGPPTKVLNSDLVLVPEFDSNSRRSRLLHHGSNIGWGSPPRSMRASPLSAFEIR